MTVPLRTFGLLGLAVALLGAGYLFVPSPGATTLPTPQPTPKPVAAAAAVIPAAAAAPAAAPTPAAKPGSTLAVNRPPVPYVTRGHTNYYASPSIEGTNAVVGSSDGKPTVDMGTFTASSLSPDSKPATDGIQQALLAEPNSSGDDSRAKAAVEQDGYRNVRGLVKDADGVWHGRAMRGRTEIAIRVNPDGSVSAD